GRIRSLQDALEHSEASLFVGTLERQSKRSAPEHGWVEHVDAVGDHDESGGYGARGELVYLLDQDVDAGAILVVRLHRAAARGEIVGFVDDQDATADGGGARLSLRERFGDARRKLADMSASANVRRSLKAHDALVDGAGHGRCDAGRERGLAASHVAGEKN